MTVLLWLLMLQGVCGTDRLCTPTVVTELLLGPCPASGAYLFEQQFAPCKEME